ncbi:glutathione-disulfide reductase [Chloroflexi bacterium TSY]|nr:glutathione-disulfide reductase [Chloroflexi bacterium TSY]
MTTHYDYDLFTIGAGSGGVRASRFAASYGARVAVAEERYYGGTCVNVGCVPKKLFVYASHYADDFEDAAGFGWTVGNRQFDWQTLVQNKDAEISRLNGIYNRILDAAGVEQFDGRATIVDPHTVEINGQQITARYILVATGGWPWMPEIPGAEHTISSNEAFYLKELPKRIIIAGGGYIATEFASIFHGLGVETIQLYRAGLFLRGFDEELRNTLAEEMRKKGIDLRFHAPVITQVEKKSDGLHATLADGSRLVADQIMFATGRRPLTANLGLENAGVELGKNDAIVVDDYSQSSVPSIYAIGDVTNRMNLTPVALAEGMAVARTLFNDQPTKPDYNNVPTAIFSQPNIGTVGLTEGAARALNNNKIDIYRSKFRALKHTLSGRDEQTLMKLIVHSETDRVLGVHMVGPDAGEIIQGFAVALKAGATKEVFDATIGIHPTSAEEFVTMREKSS